MFIKRIRYAILMLCYQPCRTVPPTRRVTQYS